MFQAKDNIYTICKLPDTFQSWFLVQQLHVWLCMVRLKVRGWLAPHLTGATCRLAAAIAQ
jgi:hypothetical protein